MTTTKGKGMQVISRRQIVGGALATACAASSVNFLVSSAAAGAAHGAPPTLKPVRGSKMRVFDPKDRRGFGGITNLANFVDPTLVRRDDQWWMYCAARDAAKTAPDLYSAFLPKGAPLSAGGWAISSRPDNPEVAAEIMPPAARDAWDGGGGRHCPSYVRGWDATLNGGEGGWQERLYYAGAAQSVGGPYSIGFAVWEDDGWVPYGDAPVFAAAAAWESAEGVYAGVYEPNVVYHDGKWRMWYVAGPPQPHMPSGQMSQISASSGHMLHGYAESTDGKTNWTRKVFWPADEDIFDNAVIGTDGRFETVFSRFALSFRPQADWGLWWRYADFPHNDSNRWSYPTQIVAAGDGTPWHAGGIWKPSFHYSDADPQRLFVFFDGTYRVEPRPTFTMGCIECELIK